MSLQPRNFTEMAVMNEGDMAVAIDKFYRPNTTRGCDCKIALMRERMQSDGRTAMADENISKLVAEFKNSNKKKLAILVCNPTLEGQANRTKYWSVVHLTREPAGNIVAIICDPYFNLKGTRSKAVCDILKSFRINEIYSKTVSTPHNHYQYGDQALYIAIALSQTTRRNFFNNDIFPINALAPPPKYPFNRKQQQPQQGTGIVINKKTIQPLEFLSLNREFLYSHFKEHDKSLHYLHLPARGIIGTRSFQEYDTRPLVDRCKDALLISRNRIVENFVKKSNLGQKYQEERNSFLKQNIKREHYQLVLQDKENLKTFANALLPFAIPGNRKAISMIYQIRDSNIVDKNLKYFVDLFDHFVNQPSLTNDVNFQNEFYRRLSNLQRGLDPFPQNQNYFTPQSTQSSANTFISPAPSTIHSDQTSTNHPQSNSIRSELDKISERISSQQSSKTLASQRTTEPANNGNSQSLSLERVRTPYSSVNSQKISGSNNSQQPSSHQKPKSLFFERTRSPYSNKINTR